MIRVESIGTKFKTGVEMGLSAAKHALLPETIPHDTLVKTLRKKRSQAWQNELSSAPNVVQIEINISHIRCF